MSVEGQKVSESGKSLSVTRKEFPLEVSAESKVECLGVFKR